MRCGSLTLHTTHTIHTLQVVLGGLLGLASAVLEPPPKGGPPDLAAAVQGASHTALCAVARMASYALPSINTALLSGGVVPLLAGLLGAPHVGIVLRRASLVTLIDLCQVGWCHAVHIAPHTRFYPGWMRHVDDGVAATLVFVCWC